MVKRLSHLFVPLIAIILGLAAGALIMLVSGYSVASGYSALWNGIFGEIYYVGETIRQITPYILSGLAVAFAFRTGLFNIGVEGQLLVGWTAAVWVGTAFDGPAYIHLPLALITAAAAGGLWGFIPGILKARFYVHEVIVTIMMNYIALHMTNYIISNVLTDHQDKTGKFTNPPPSALLFLNSSPITHGCIWESSLPFSQQLSCGLSSTKLQKDLSSGLSDLTSTLPSMPA